MKYENLSKISEDFFMDHISDHFGKSGEVLGKLEDCEECTDLIREDKEIYGAEYIENLIEKVRNKFS